MSAELPVAMARHLGASREAHRGSPRALAAVRPARRAGRRRTSTRPQALRPPPGQGRAAPRPPHRRL